MVLIIALASKNAILIVEFARDLRTQGQSIHGAAIAAAKMRFRPILMTSFAFILGVLPLVFATGAAAASRRSLGTAVCSGTQLFDADSASRDSLDPSMVVSLPHWLVQIKIRQDDGSAASLNSTCSVWKRHSLLCENR